MKPYTEEMLLFLSEPESQHYARLLLPEIADVLGVTASQLESKPIDVQLILAQTYVNCWHREILEQDILLQNEPKENEKQVQREEPTEKKTHFRNMEMERIR